MPSDRKKVARQWKKAKVKELCPAEISKKKCFILQPANVNLGLSDTARDSFLLVEIPLPELNKQISNLLQVRSDPNGSEALIIRLCFDAYVSIVDCL